jgi:hypothetical protein
MSVIPQGRRNELKKTRKPPFEGMLVLKPERSNNGG